MPHSRSVNRGQLSECSSTFKFFTVCCCFVATAGVSSTSVENDLCANSKEMDIHRFKNEYEGKKPVIVVHGDDYQQAFRMDSKKASMMRDWGAQSVSLGTANTHTGRTMKHTTLNEYLTYISTTDFRLLRGNETWYLFGDQLEEFWDTLLASYVWPPISVALKSLDPHNYFQTAAFGIGGKGSGVPFHTHGAGWSEILHGSKHWYLFDLTIGKNYPQDDPQQSQWDWTITRYPQLSDHEREALYECTIVPVPNIQHDHTSGSILFRTYAFSMYSNYEGEALYFPAHWFHATLNMDEYTCFVSTFT